MVGGGHARAFFWRSKSAQMTRNIVDPPTLFEASLELEWTPVRLVEEMILSLKAKPRFAHYHLERLAPTYPTDANAGDNLASKLRPTHVLRSSGPADYAADLKNQRRTIFLSDTTLYYRADTPPYPLWLDALKPELDELIEFIFDEVENIGIRGVNLRFVNAFSNKHEVFGVGDLNLQIQIHEQVETEDIALTYVQRQRNCSAIVRIASGSVVKGAPVENLNALLDVEITAQDTTPLNEQSTLKDWVSEAHDLARDVFFSLFTKKMNDNLVKKRS